MINKYIKYFYPETDSKEPLISCMEKLFDYLSFNNFNLRNILIINIFFKSNENFDNIKYIERQLLKFQLDVPTAKIPTSPEKFDYVFEVWFIKGAFNTVNFGDNFKIIVRNDLYLLYASVMNYKKNDENYFEKTFDDLKQILHKNRFPIDSIFRQWGYIGNILQIKDGIQNYQKYNYLRAEFYSEGKWKKGYPCSTGIGTKDDLLNIAIIASRGHINYDEYNLSNPLQVEPANYDENVLVSDSQTKYPPLFERGKIICTDDNVDFYISGTSSIRGQKSVSKGDLILQTQITIENIEKLLDIDRIKKQIKEKHFNKIKSIDLMKSFSYLRVYLNDINQINLVKPFILKKFGAVPTIYLEADICRQDLTIEIEGAIFI